MGIVPILRQNRAMGVLLCGILLFHAGWYMLLPFFAILFTGRRNLSAAEVGLVLAAQSFSLLLGSLVGGLLADRVGRKRTMVLGLVLRTVGVGALGIDYGLPALLGAAAVAGVGGGLYGPAAKAALTALATDGNRATVFSLRGIAANIGTSGGPLLGTLLVRGPMPVLFGTAAVLHLALGAVTWTLFEGDQPSPDREHAPWRDVLSDRPFLAFSGVTVLAWALFSQLAIAVPLYASRVLGLEASIGLLWTVSSLTVIALQVPITRLVLGRLHPMTAMAGGAVLLGAGLGLVGLAHSFAGLIGAVLVFVLGEMLLLPTSDSAVSTMAPAAAVGSYFGIASFAWGLGEGLGNVTGGLLMQVALRGGRIGLPWVIYAAAGVVVGVLYGLLRRRVAERTSRSAAN